MKVRCARKATVVSGLEAPVCARGCCAWRCILPNVSILNISLEWSVRRHTGLCTPLKSLESHHLYRFPSTFPSILIPFSWRFSCDARKTVVPKLLNVFKTFAFGANLSNSESLKFLRRVCGNVLWTVAFTYKRKKNSPADGWKGYSGE